MEWVADPSVTRYNLPIVIYYGKDVNLDQLVSGFEKLIETRKILKTCFIMDENGEPRQYYDPDMQIPIKRFSMSEEEAQEYIHNGFLRPFSPFDHSPLVRFEFISTPQYIYGLVDMHHTISDGMTYSPNFSGDVAAFYKNEGTPDGDYGLFQYAEDESSEIGGDVYNKAKEYYAQKFDGIEFTNISVIPQNPEGNSVCHSEKVRADFVDKWAEDNGTSPNLVFMAAFSYVVSVMSREQKIAYYTLNHGRMDKRLLNAYGMFVKSVPILADVDRNLSVLDFIKGFRRELMGTIRYGAYPFSHFCRDLKMTPSLEFSFQGFKIQEYIPFEHSRAAVVQIEKGKTRSDMSCVIYYINGDYEIRLTSSDAINSKEKLEVVGKAIKAAMLNMMADPTATLEHISLMDEAEKKRVETMHITAQAEVPYKLYYEPIERNAVEIPERTALIAKDCTLTFAEFNIAANRVANGLIKRGVKQGDRVVLLLPRRSYAIYSMFGVSKAGAAYIPCDPAYPADRINLIMTDSEAQYVLTTKEHLSDYPSDKVIDIEELINDSSVSVENPCLNVSPDDLAYLIYTSGSTGKPKGVMLRHRGIVNYLYDHPANVHIHGLKELDVKSFVSITTLSFDMSLKEFAGSLFNGITSILADEDEVMDAYLLAELMKRTGAEGINGTCSRILSYLELPEFSEALSHCKTVWSGGEAYPQQLLDTLRNMGVHIFNTYGPTEITVSSNIKDLTNSTKVSVGHPLLNYVEFVVDQYNNELPVGITGELLIGGPGVAKGYNNLPEMTAERFVEYKGVRVYRSGDLARWLPDGDVEIIGRTDSQVKLRGFRIELGEVESKAVQFGGVKQAVADVKNIGGMQHLCLYFTSESDLEQNTLREFLSESLTEYMVPTAYMRLDKIPLTPNGKADRKHLPIPVLALEEIVNPETEMEKKVFEIVASSLNLNDFGVTNNLVSLGLSSLASMRLSATLQKELGVRILMKEIMENPTVRQIAALVESGDRKVEEGSKLKPHPIQTTYPMSESQKGMYIDCVMNPDALQYNIPVVLHFKDIDADKLEQAFYDVIEAHPYIKVRLQVVGEEVMQVRNDNEPVTIHREKLTEFPTREFLQSRVKPFRIHEEPLYRITIYEYASDVFVLMDIHHIIGDGSSNFVIARELERAYKGEKLIAETYTAYDRTLDEAELIKSDRYAVAESYFDSLVGGVDATVYPHSSVPDEGRFQGVSDIEIKAADIEAFCKRHNLPVSGFFLVVFHQVLHRLTREDNTLLYFISNGRSELLLDNFFGVLVKTLPSVMTDFKGSMVDAANKIKEQMQQTISNDFYPFTDLVNRHGLKAEILYNYFVDLQTTVDLDGKCLEAYGLDWDMAKTPLSITMLRADNGNYTARLEYDATLYNRRDMETLNRVFRNFAENSVKNEYYDLSMVPLLDSLEQDKVLTLCTGNKMEYDSTQTFPSMFIACAKKHRTSIAIVDEKSPLTYAKLNMLTGVVAMKLVDMGVRKGNFVSIMLGYQKEFVAAAIGVERSGGAYVPLDYDYPNERLLYMLRDSESKVLITSHAIFDEKNSGGEFDAEQILFIDDFILRLLGKLDDNGDEFVRDLRKDLNGASLKSASFNLAEPDGIAYMIYTSGSTGKPKGVMIPHSAKANFVTFIAKEWGHTEKSRICCHSSFSFDASIEDLYPVLTVGGTLYTVPKEARKDMEQLHKFIIKNNITGGCYTTQLGVMLLQMYPDMPLDYLVVGGEKMNANPECKTRVINTYGPTEFTVDSTFYTLVPGKEYKNIPIGRPLYNLNAYIIDPQGHLMPQGACGELCMSGVQMAAGYWKREDLTAEKFAPCRFLPNTKIYHTGDLARYNEDGDIEYLGRIDSQVKLRGFRIELGEIETLIASYQGVEMESVQVKEIGGVQHLCAYYTANCPIDENQLKEYLAQQLTDYMVPTAYMQLDKMPLTPNGKVNTKQLPLPTVKAEEKIAPVTKTEKQMFDLVAEVIGNSDFGVTQNLISLGVTSLSAMRLSVMAHERYGFVIATKDILTNPTIRDIAVKIDGEADGSQELETEETGLVFDKRHYYYPLTENQRGVYIDWDMHRTALQYNIAGVKVWNDIDAHKLIDALRDTVDAHSYIKTRMAYFNGDVCQYRRDEEPVEVLFTELNEEPDKEFFQSRVRPFDLFNDNLYRFEVYKSPTKVYLFRDMHHIVFDGASDYFFMIDLQKVLDGEKLSPETYTAFDRVLDEWKLMRSDRFAEAQSYFDKLLESAEIASYNYSATGLTGRGLTYASVPAKLVDDFCHTNGTTQSNTFLTAFMQVLHSVTREENIVITTINNGRSDVRMMRTMGMFVKTIPVVSQLESGLTFAEAVKAMQSQFIETQARDIYPFTKMVERHKLRAEIIYAYEGGFADDNTNVAGSEFSLELDTVKMPLDCNILPEKDSYKIRIEYNKALYTEKQMNALASAIAVFVENAINSGVVIKEIPMLNAEWSEKTMAVSSGEMVDYDKNLTFVQAFMNIAKQNPDKIAVSDITRSLTYAELDGCTNALAFHLLQAGVMPNDFVGVMVDRSVWFTMSVLAIHKVGAAYTPLDVDYPYDRLQYIIENSELKVLVTTHSVMDAKQEEGGLTAPVVIYLDDLDLSKKCDSVCLAKPDNIAYMIYTSGSTGLPKGVILHQKGLMNFTVALSRAEALTHNDRIAAHRSFSFDAHIGDIYPILYVGGEYHIMPSEIRNDLKAVRDFITDRNITGCGFTTSLTVMLLNAYPEIPVRFITAGGEKLSGVKSDHISIINLYGPTECTNDSTLYVIEPGNEISNIPIGRPVANCFCFVLDKQGRMVPYGASGELCIAGPQVGYGYWHLEDKTAAAFVECPYLKNQKMYRTGDLVRYNDDGQLEYMGRIDSQVKLRGFRIELGEIEGLVMCNQSIKMAVAAVKTLANYDHLVLYYVVKDGCSVSSDDLRKSIEESSLASYMRPEIYMELETMPTLPNGKVNRKKLPDPVLEQGEFVEASTKEEENICSTVCSLLGIDKISVEANLISMGLTSLSAMRLSAMINQKYDIYIPTTEILFHPRIKDMAEYIAVNDKVENIDKVYEKRELYPLTENQRGVYLDWEMNRSALQYNIPDVVVFCDYDKERLHNALIDVVEAHPYLKTRLVQNGEDVMQIRRDEAAVEVSFTELTEKPTSEFFQNRVRPFDLFNDNLYRLELYKYDTYTYLFMDIHHIVFDGASNFLFRSELEKAYSGITLDKETFTAFDRALYEQEYMDSEAFKNSEAYFDSILGGAEVAVYSHSDGATGDANHSARVSDTVSAGNIDDYCGQNGFTVSNFFMTALMQTLHRVTREDSIVVSTIDNGRTSIAMQNIMGMFVKTLPIVSTLDTEKAGELKFADAVATMQKQFQTTVANSLYPYTRMVQRYGIRPEIMCGFQGGIKEVEDFVDADDKIEVELDTAKAPLCIFFTPDDNKNYRIDAEYSTALYTEDDIRLLVSALKNFMINATITKGSIASISIVSDDECNEIMAKSKGEDLEYNKDETFANIVLHYAKTTPDAIAVADRDGSYTFKELDMASARVAKWLMTNGVGKNEFVCVKLPRQKEFLAVILGIQRIGAAYVPVDMEYPEDRIQYMVDDSKAKIMVTEENLTEIFASEPVLGYDVSAPDTLAYMIYTSGSTGKPKGVMIANKSLRAFVAWRVSALKLNADSRSAVHASFSFDASIDDLITPLACGGSVHIMPEEIRKDMDAMLEFIKEHKVNGMSMSTALGMTFVNSFDLPLRYIMMGGEKMLPMRKVNMDIVNGYGPTEFTVCSSYHFVNQDSDGDIPIGRPVPNSYSFVCDKFGNLMPNGLPGELCLCGEQMSNGYWGRAELTKEKFTAVTFASGLKMYRTGDLAKYGTDGNLIYMGRIDSQVKLRGFRIEMGEIENQAKLFPNIKSVAADVKEIGSGKHLCLYFTASEKINIDDLQNALASKLTPYMVPEAYMQLEVLPLTPNGKVNRKALPIPELRSGVEFVEPDGELEVIVSDAFAQVLNFEDKVGALDSFFALGGDSIKCIRLVSILKQKGIDIQVSQIMKLKTVREIAKNCKTADNIQISQTPINGDVADSAIVGFFFDLNLPKENHFNQSYLLQAKERVNMDAMKKVFAAIWKQHDMLRAVVKDKHLFVRDADAVMQFDEIDVHDVASAGVECTKRQEGIDMAGSLFNVTVLHLPDYDLLLMVCHHIVVDAVSWRIILDDLAGGYAQALEGGEVKLQEKTHTYKDYVEACYKYRNSYKLETEISYWQSVQQKLDSLETSDCKNHNRDNGHIAVTLDSENTDKLVHNVSTVFSTEINDLLMTAVGRSYMALTGNNALSVQMEGHGREDLSCPLHTECTVGWFTSVFPVVIDGLSGDMRKDIRNVKEIMHRIPNKGVGYNILRFVDGNEAIEFSRDKVALVGFNYLGEMTSGNENDNVPFTASKEVVLSPDFASENKFGPSISINCSISDGVFGLSMDYDRTVISDGDAKKFADGIVSELKDITAYLLSKTDKEITASDLGELEWSDEEFENVYSQFMKMGTPIRRIYPLSPMQEGILLHFIMSPNSLAYRLVSTFSMDMLPTYNQLRYALDRLGAKHEVLRSALIYRGVEQYRQAIVDRPLGLEMVDVSNEADIEEAAHNIHLREQQRGFDMQNDPLFRIICVKTSDVSCKLILAVHHILVDGWCIGLFTADLLKYMTEAITGKESAMDNSNDGRYERFVRELRLKNMNAGLEYWRNLLGGYNIKAVIPSYGLVPENEQTDDKDTLVIKGDVVTQLQNLCNTEQVTMNTVVELAWGLTLHVFNHTNDAVFVKVVSGRNNSSESVEDLVGLFINSVPVRVVTNEGQSIRDAVKAVHTQAVNTNEWDFCPLSQIQQQSELGQDLFQSIVAFENYADNTENIKDYPFTLKHEYSKEESFNDITVTAYTGNGTLVVNIEFDKTKYTMDYIDRVLSVFRQIVSVIADNPDMDVQKISALDKSATLELMELGRGDTLRYNKKETLIDLFKKQVDKTPDSTCVVYKDKSFTYAEIDKITDKLAVYLKERYGIGCEQAVGVMIDRSELMVIYPIAVMKAGAAYMPLDFHFPTERLAFMCSDAGVKLILTEDNRVAEALPEFDGDVFLSAEISNLPDVTMQQVKSLDVAKPENMYVVLYTSGSTGTPKGVMLEHHNIVNFCHWYVREFNVTEKDRAVAYANFGFDAHMMDIYPALIVGASVYIIASDMRMDLMAMNRYMEDNNLSIAFMTTQVGYMFATTIENHSLRLLSVGGEKLQPLRKPAFRFYNGYGPTECTLYSTCYNIITDYDNSLIGRPLANYQLFVVDQNMHLVPRGAAGELVVAGEGVGRGYLNRPDINAEKFITLTVNVGAQKKQFKAYRTGDLVRWSKDGNIDYMGRMDGQVKLRGLRIEMGEIEARVSKYQGIKACAVAVKEISGTQHICCYMQADEQIDQNALREFIGQKLADYMVPTAYIQLDELPLTPNGKVNRRALPVPTITIQTENVPPETHKEQCLFNIAKELLGTDNFGVTDDITKLGLTSLLGIKMVVMADKQGIKIKLANLMKARTIRGVLEDNMGVGCWINKFDREKPVVVMVCGATPYKDMMPYSEKLCENYSVFVFEPLGEHYDLIFRDADINEVIETYYSLLDWYISELGVKVAAFTGHCFGGELAYRLAVRYEQETGVSAPMIMLDVFWRVEKSTNSMEAMMSLISEDVYNRHKEAIDSFRNTMRMYDSLARQGEPPLYKGKVVLFRALQEEPMAPEMKAVFDENDARLKVLWDLNTSDRHMDNSKFWSKYYPDVEVYGVEAHHMSMLTQEFVGQYVDWIKKETGK